MTPIINTRRLREDHPSIRPRRQKKRRVKKAGKHSLLGTWLRHLIQEIRELHADVPPPMGKLEKS